MKAAIVTGASGFIGRAVTRELLGNGYEVYGVTRDEKALPAGCVPVACDLREAEKLAGLIPQGVAEVFYHLAWGGVSGPARGDERVQQDNVRMAVDCVKVAKKLGCRRFVGAGTIAEREVVVSLYGGGQPEALWPYGAAKLAARAMAMKTAAEIGLAAVWTTLTNAYGPGDSSSRMVNAALRKISAGETPGFTEGRQNYDFVYIEDAARAFRLIGERGRPGRGYTIGSGHPKALREFLLEMRAAVAPKLEFKFGAVPFVGKSLPLSAFDCYETERDTGFKAEMPFAEGCRRLYEWLKREARQ